MTKKVPVSVLRDQVTVLLQKEKLKEALECYVQLENAEPKEPRWPHRKGDLLLRMKRPKDAVAAYEKAVDIYASQGFVARAAAMAKVILGLDPSRMDVLERVDGKAALELRQRREGSQVAPLPASPPPAEAARPPAPYVARGMDEDLVPMPPEPAARPAARPPTVPPLPRPEARPEEIAGRVSLVFDAPMLRPADNADDDEVRFVELEEDEAIELDFSDVELVYGRPASVSTSAEGPSAAAVARMPAVPLLAEVPKEALSKLLGAAELVDLADSEVLVKAGEAADSLYILAEGTAEVLVPGVPAGTLMLGEGEIVGETCLFPGVRRKADVVARGHLLALKLGREALLDLVTAHPIVGDILYELLTKRILANLLRTHELFAAFDPGTRLELARLFEVRRAGPGTRLLEAGKRSDGMYVPLLGLFEATRPDGRVVEVPAGRLLGEGSLMTRAPSQSTVETKTDALVLRLSTMRFTELASTFPPVLAHLTDLASRDSLEDAFADDLPRL